MWHPQAGVLILQGLSGALFGALLFYLLGSLLLRRWVRINVYQLSLSMAAALTERSANSGASSGRMCI